jgi:pimeloyl-ACP methyl ester carboxylesterase
MIAFISALDLDEIDLLGFSIGGVVAQELCVRPADPRPTTDLGRNWSEGLISPSAARNPCHASVAVVWSRNEKPSFAGLSDGRYWARTSDPQLVELVLSQLS